MHLAGGFGFRSGGLALKYRIVFDKPAEKYIRKQPKRQQERLIRAIRLLPDIGDIKPMSGHENLFRLRVGDVRV